MDRSKFRGLTKEEFYEFLGILHSDGWMIPEKGEIGIEVIDRDFAERFKILSEKLSGKKIQICSRKRNSIRYLAYLCSKEISLTILENFGSTNTSEWVVPKELVKESKTTICSYLRGLYAGDGCLASEKKRVKGKLILTTKNRENCEAIVNLMEKIGINSNYMIRERKRISFENSSTSYCELVYCDYRSIRKFMELVGFPHIKRKQAIWNKLSKRRDGNERLPFTKEEKIAVSNWTVEGLSVKIIALKLGRTTNSIIGLRQRLKMAKQYA